MYCSQCGEELTALVKFCAKCGAKNAAATPAPSVSAEPQAPPQVEASPATREAPSEEAFPSAGADAEPSVPSADTQSVLPVAETRRNVMPLVLSIVALVCLGGWVAYITTTASQNLTDALPNGIVEATNPAELRVQANAGDAEAQDNLGVAYYYGRGVPQDDAQAVSWFRQAAEQGHALAQFSLGFMYYTGQGVAQDYVEAHKWVTLAASRATGDNRKRFVALRDSLAKQMTPAQLAEAQRLAR